MEDYNYEMDKETMKYYVDDDIEIYNLIKDIAKPIPNIYPSKNGYNVDEGDGVKYFNFDGTENENYWELYSEKQRPFFQRCMRQLKDVWFNVYTQIDFFRAVNTSEEVNLLMKKVYRMFFTEYKFMIQYYSQENIKIRKQKKYVHKKLYRLKNRKLKI